MKALLSLRFYVSAFVFLILSTLAASAEAVPVLQTKTETYRNVTLISQTGTHAFVQHAKGVATVKLGDIDVEALKALGISPSAVAVVSTSAGDAGQTPLNDEGKSASASNMSGQLRQSMAPVLALIAGVWLATLAAVLLMYVFYIILVRMICKKAGCQTGWWIWVPFPALQRYALLKAAGMSWLWILATVILNAVAGAIGAEQSGPAGLVVLLAWVALFVTEHVIWSVKISKARGKGVLTMICLIIPFTLPFAFMYLAFSGGSGAETATEVDAIPPVKSVQTEPLPA